MDRIKQDIAEEKEEIKRIWQAIEQINIIISRIETKIDQNHICKYNGKVGELVEFKEQSTPIRNSIFRRLDKQEDEIEHLKEIVLELRMNAKFMEDMKIEQKRWLMGIAASIIVFFAVFIYKTVLLGI